MTNNLEVYNSIRNLYFQVVSRATDMGLDIENVSIYVRPENALALELGEFFILEYPLVAKDIPVIVDSSIGQSDIWIHSPDWSTVEDRKLWQDAEEI